jgi:hypothetical protein
MIKKVKETDQDTGEISSKDSEAGNATPEGTEGDSQDSGTGLNDQGVIGLKEQLQTEISRLQEQFKRQKNLEKKLEDERKKLRLETEKLSLKRQEPYGIYPAGVGIPRDKGSGAPVKSISETGDGTGPVTVNGQEPVGGTYELFKKIEAELQELKMKIETKADEEYVIQIISQNEQLSKINEKFSEFKHMIVSSQKEFKRLEVKLNELLEDIGYEESLDIGKVPPDILELVYETIIDDVIKKIKHDLGAHDTDIVINQTLEEIRFRTSGSELFKYDGGKLKLRNLGKYIDQKSISAKQIHTTFNELLSKLVEKIPDYEPKNFKAMIKIKSQEYSLDKVTGIYDRFKEIENKFKCVEEEIKRLNKDIRDYNATNSMIMSEFKGFNLRVTDIAKRVDAALPSKTKSQPTVKEPADKKSSDINEKTNHNGEKEKDIKKKEEVPAGKDDSEKGGYKKDDRNEKKPEIGKKSKEHNEKGEK